MIHHSSQRLTEVDATSYLTPSATNHKNILKLGMNPHKCKHISNCIQVDILISKNQALQILYHIASCNCYLFGAILSEPHSNVENGMVVCGEKRDCNTLLQFDTVVHVQTNMINLWILPYKC